MTIVSAVRVDERFRLVFVKSDLNAEEGSIVRIFEGLGGEGRQFCFSL